MVKRVERAASATDVCACADQKCAEKEGWGCAVLFTVAVISLLVASVLLPSERKGSSTIRSFYSSAKTPEILFGNQESSFEQIFKTGTPLLNMKPFGFTLLVSAWVLCGAQQDNFPPSFNPVLASVNIQELQEVDESK